MSPMTRYLSRIHYSQSGCWEWTGHLSAGRYGSFRVNGKTVKVHRWIYATLYGSIPENMVVCHTCDNTRCVNPEHLFIGTQYDNVQDCIKKGRAYHPKGPKKNPCKLFGDDNPSRKYPETRPRGTSVNTCKLTENDVKEIRRAYAAKELNQVQLSKKYNLSQPNISAILLRKTWAHIK